MKNLVKNTLLVIAAIVGLLFTFGSEGAFDSSLTAGGDGESKGTVNLSYVTWDTEIASTNVIAVALEQAGYDVTLTPLDNAIMWSSVATGEADAMVGAWLPNTHKSQLEQYGAQMTDLGPNLEGAVTGIVVPTYMEDVNSIADLSDQANKTITGIEPGAGVVAAAEQAVEDYDNLSDWQVQTSSSGAMTTALGTAIANEEPIVITGWSPHWMFQEYDLKYLEDPEGTFGDGETINTFVRQGFAEDMPEANQILDNFHWEVADMESVMADVQAGTDPKEAAEKWVEANQDTVDEWLGK
ncbi:glycine betaine ABC transporter substrate-binding protein [Aerococcus agrisoli]|uniref:Glycine betaine ABC transporter substrate-binding protein n=1 Tax=Aerococcus agrisoli TaxID=2487350 RepID=A0A3N4GDU2_9LACT|nr:glycine betaine ABC transporter substrate-binding protein [Aerococcus agrisoli]